jgi:hypothetical protein
MNKLTKEQLVVIEAAISECDIASTEIQVMVDEYNSFIGDWKDAIEKNISEYNGKLSALSGVYEQASDEAQKYYDERSETWQNSEKGEEYASWINQLETVGSDLEDLDIEVPDTIDDPDFPDWANPENWLPPNAPGE